ncbi:acyl-CoA dehydrogenase family protein [Kribbella sp. NPDC050820]|uniref:acyl-CoA dehydrogenase family protein n=1 Tax=Kribbella sp. NPDC050820 TaxID=3155408 RepID=UPI0033C1D3DF
MTEVRGLIRSQLDLTTRTAGVRANGRILARFIPKAELHIYPGGHVELITEAHTLVPVIPLPVRGGIMTTDPIDFYGLELLLHHRDRELLHAVREFGDKQVTPIINDYWTRAAFPFELIPAIRDLGIVGTPYTGYGCQDRSFLLDGLIAMELSTADPSIATFFGVHSGLLIGSIHLCGSEDQKEHWLPGPSV